MSFECRENCGACCIAPSINNGFLGMPDGKPAGVACVHLNDEYRCKIFHSPDRPLVCSQFQAEKAICGDNRIEALNVLAELEDLTK